MASASVPCPKCSVAGSRVPHFRSTRQRASSLVSVSKVGPPAVVGSWRPQFPLMQGSDWRGSTILKAQLQEIPVEGSSNSAPLTSTKSETQSSKTKNSDTTKESSGQAPVPESALSAFMAEASHLVKLVDSKDIMELSLKFNDCEIIIKKKEALLQPVATIPPLMFQYPQFMQPPQPPISKSAPPLAAASPVKAAPAAAPALLSAAKVGGKSSLPPLNCPMAGTFYRSPAPGEPPFVKVGDKVQKGQVVCIIEAMKLMNEIEADQSGTVVEILAEDGKPVSLDTPLLAIQP
ncbi:biotin carboxyl carrier protein of acetyl-CoA carboxylase, chloroplastic [Typha latifolia]|uniref:biotin carboxyl carrier protein of acetyl-CoA carboxylase, chloroplastic n=1 Tax=Typha latifolia TaxID=4733 RepID=UPI003C2ACFD7